MARKKYDTTIIAALVSGATIEEAAKAAGVSSRTAHRRLKSPEFKLAFDKASNAIVRYAVARMTAAHDEAAETLVELLKSEDEKIRLQAIKTLFDLTPKLMEKIELEERVKLLENEFKYLREER